MGITIRFVDILMNFTSKQKLSGLVRSFPPRLSNTLTGIPGGGALNGRQWVQVNFRPISDSGDAAKRYMIARLV